MRSPRVRVLGERWARLRLCAAVGCRTHYAHMPLVADACRRKSRADVETLLESFRRDGARLLRLRCVWCLSPLSTLSQPAPALWVCGDHVAVCSCDRVLMGGGCACVAGTLGSFAC